jgi:drug/metabolite transporter (DMT)-like permease
VLDMTANAIYLLAARRGLLALVAVLSSLYPAGTVVLARIVLRERLVRVQLAGLAMALAGIVLIAAG